MYIYVRGGAKIGTTCYSSVLTESKIKYIFLLLMPKNMNNSGKKEEQKKTPRRDSFFALNNCYNNQFVENILLFSFTFQY